MLHYITQEGDLNALCVGGETSKNLQGDRVCKTSAVLLRSAPTGHSVPLWFHSGSSLVPLWFHSGSSLVHLCSTLVPLRFLSGSTLVPLMFLSGSKFSTFPQLQDKSSRFTIIIDNVLMALQQITFFHKESLSRIIHTSPV